MSFFKELFSSMKFNARERTTNIYIGSFAFSWVTINWKFWIILLFGEGPVESRIEHVSKIINWLDGLALPILMSAAICFVLPIVNKFIAKFQYEPNNYVKRMNDVSETKSLKRLAGIERLKAKAESARSRENAAQELAIQQLNEKIQESKDNSQQLTNEIEVLNEKITELNNTIIKNDDIHNKQIREKDTIIETLTNTKSDNNEQIKKLKEQTLEFKKQVDSLKKNLSSNTLGAGLPKYKANESIIGDTVARINLGQSLTSFNSPSAEALNRAMQSPAIKAINDAVNSPAIKSIKKASENSIAEKIIAVSNHYPSQAANVSKQITDLYSTGPTQNNGLKSDNLSDDLENK
ncbi:hypothetical protein [Klebsiella michiganensis]|uniref:hypothetical protein n=1 Tax=Klebsiella michiganensis TaxID=1134687 RepID=UPI003F50C063